MAKKKIRVGLIGHQFMGVAHSNAYRNAGMWYDLPVEIEMKCVCAKDTPERLEAFAHRYGWQETEADWKKLVSRDDIDLISVATPGFLHKEMVIEAAKNNKHILCEKPLANNYADACDMLKAVEGKSLVHACGFSYRFTPATALAKKLIADGKLGTIYHVHARYAQDWMVDPKAAMVWRLQKELAGSGSLGDICSHSIDMSRFMTGAEITSLVANCKTLVKQRPLSADDPDGPQGEVTVDDVAQVLCEYDNGATGCFEATRFAGGRKNHNCIEINGSLGSIYWDFEEQNYLEFCDRTLPVELQGFTKINATWDGHPYGGGPWPQGHGIGYADCFVLEVAHLVTAIAKGESFSPSFADGVTCQRVLEAVQESSEQKKWISLL
ncbi:MAG: Gfo/Idh/MocA family oxidoreductase [Planctomycetia bacterium]|nr:Gfo/Idh/MocA family oxidoreductase [Planctomycetia bacterium]